MAYRQDERAARWRPEVNSDSPAVIDPDIRSGRPAVNGISTEILFEQSEAGESDQDLAEAFGLTISQVRSAVLRSSSPVGCGFAGERCSEPLASRSITAGPTLVMTALRPPLRAVALRVGVVG